MRWGEKIITSSLCHCCAWERTTIYIIIIFASLIRHLFRNGIVFVRGGIISRANNQSNFEDFSAARVFFFFFSYSPPSLDTVKPWRAPGAGTKFGTSKSSRNKSRIHIYSTRQIERYIGINARIQGSFFQGWVFPRGLTFILRKKIERSP